MEDSKQENIVDWSYNEWWQFRNWLEDLLYKEVVEVIFTKVDGTERTMLATKKQDIVRVAMERRLVLDLETPGALPTKEKNPRKAPADKLMLTVWDTERGDWRTIKVKSITNILTLVLKYDYKPKRTIVDLDILYFDPRN